MTSEVLERQPILGGGRPLPPAGHEGGEPGPHREAGGPLADTARVGLLAFLGSVSMLFIGFTSALLLRRASTDWQPLRAPGLLYLSSALLVLSSVFLERARRLLLGWDLRASQRFTLATGLCGAGFVAAQAGAWRQLAAAGVFLGTNPSSSFFYMLTGLHALHVLGGLAWYGVVAMRLRRMAFAPGQDGLGLFAIYWHYLGGLWIYLLVLMFGI
jgi:cytochrome c oxidase subunit 3